MPSGSLSTCPSALSRLRAELDAAAASCASLAADAQRIQTDHAAQLRSADETIAQVGAHVGQHAS